MGLRATMGWMLHGRANTTATLEALSADLRELQAKVDRLGAAFERDVRDLRDQQLTELDKVREAVIVATDDLSTRIAALHRNASSS